MSKLRKSPLKKINSVYCDIVDLNDVTTAFIKLKGRFPNQSSRGNECALVGCYYDYNLIRGSPIKNRKGPEIAEAWDSSH